MSSHGASAQLSFDGLEEFLKPNWQPVPATLHKVKNYFLGYVASDREIFARRKWIAAKNEVSVRTLARYLKYLAESGWMTTIRRTARTAYRKVIKAPVPSAVPSQGPASITEEKPLGLRGWRRVVSVPLVLFRIPEYWRKRSKTEAGTKTDYQPWRDGLHPDLLREVGL